MKIKLTLVILIILQLSCKNDTDKQIKPSNSGIQKVENQKKRTKGFDFEAYKISKGKIGEIEVGMNINDAEKKLNGLRPILTSRPLMFALVIF